MRRTLSSALLLSLLAAAAPGCWSSEEKAPPALSVSPDHLDFGQAGVGETVHRTVVLTNRGKAPLAVDRIGVTSPFEALEASLSLAPGESRSLGVKFSPAESGRAEALLGIESARGVVRVSLRGEAHGVPALYVDRKRVEFGEVALGELSTALVTIENRGQGALRLSKLAVATPFEASLDASEVAPGKSARVEIRFAPKSARDWDAALRVESNDPRAERVTIALAGAGVEEPPTPAIEVRPMALDFGVISVGRTQESRLEIRNAGRDPLTLSSVTLEPPFHASTGSRRIAPGSSFSLAVSFSPSEQGPRMASMQIHSNDPRHGVLVVALLGDAVDRVAASEAARETRSDGEEETASSVDGDTLAEVGDAGGVGSGGTRSLVDVEGEVAESVESEPAEEGFDFPSGPRLAEGSHVVMGSYGMRSGDVYVDSFSVDPDSGTVSLAGVELPTIYTGSNQSFSFSETSGIGSIGSRGEMRVALPVEVFGAAGASGALEVVLTTGTASIFVGGRRVSIQGAPMGPDGIATLVGLASFNTGPLQSDTVRIVLEVQVGN